MTTDGPSSARLQRTVAGALLVLALGLVPVSLFRALVLPDVLLLGWDDVLPVVILGCAVASAWLRASARGLRADDVALTVGLTAYATGWAYWAFAVQPLDVMPFPTLADPAWLALYPCAIVALAVHGSHGDRLRASSWLDVLIGATGVSALVSAFMAGFLADAAMGSWAVVVSGAYVAGDTALVLAVLATLGMRGFRAPWHLWVRAAGVLVLVASDVAVVQIISAAGEVPQGHPVGVGWLVAVCLLAASVGRQSRSGERSPRRRAVLAVPLAGTLVSVAVLSVEQDAVVRMLALTALLLAVARMGLAFHELERLAGSREMAVTDELTGLTNRRGFYQQAGRVLRAGHPATLLLLDLDGFKEVNDTLGHAAGDALLVQVAGRLRAAARTRASHRDADVVARLGGDEFAVLLPGTAPDGACRAVERVVGALATGYVVEGVPVRVSAAAGVVHSPEHGSTVDELLRRADVAMYASKSGRAGAVVYRPDLDTRSRDGLERAERCRAALEDGRVVLHFQPKIDLRSGAVTGVEALARLGDPVDGLVLPGDFLGPLAQAGELGRLTGLVLDGALEQARVWRDAGRDLRVAVNVPADAVVDATLPRLVADHLARHGLDGTALVLEVTEEVLLHDHAAGQAVLGELRSMGVRIAIDDYGTGYSSLAYLRELPLDELKLDRAFVQALGEDPRAERIVESTAALAHSLGLRIVVEGVETEEELAVVTACGCDEAQGYLIARPVPAEALEELLEGRGVHRVGRGPAVEVPHPRPAPVGPRSGARRP